VRDGERIRVGAGVLMSDLLSFAAKNGLAGLEWAGGLPGTVGGAIRGNAGAFGSETKDSVLEVTSINIHKKDLELVKRSNKECVFGYRDSYFKKHDGQEIIVDAIFSLQSGEPAAITQAMMDKINYRKTRHPMEYPNIGSIFKNVDLKIITKKKQEDFLHVVKSDPFPVVPTAYLITEAGLKGVSFGGAMISPKHPNFIVNSLNASSDDVKHLIKLVKSTIKKKFDIELEEEIINV
jgi:UDP-N-acetylmuramate dehydrogenase